MFFLPSAIVFQPPMWIKYLPMILPKIFFLKTPGRKPKDFFCLTGQTKHNHIYHVIIGSKVRGWVAGGGRVKSLESSQGENKTYSIHVEGGRKRFPGREHQNVFKFLGEGKLNRGTSPVSE